MWMLLNEFPGFHNPLDLPVSTNLTLYGREVSLSVRVSEKTPYYSRPPFHFGALQATLRLVAQLVQRPSHCVTEGSIDQRDGAGDSRINVLGSVPHIVGYQADPKMVIYASNFLQFFFPTIGRLSQETRVRVFSSGLGFSANANAR